ncbi:MAG: preprotein translocase subunit SecG [Pseudomonadota bacterium]
MENVVLTVHLILALALIAIVLMQRSEGGGLGIGGGGGGGGGGGLMSSRGTATALSKLTWALAVLFIATSLTLTVLAARDAADRSVLDRLGTEPAVEEGEVAPIPPVPDVTPGAPALPPAAD